jgi:hypothetical protein
MVKFRFKNLKIWELAIEIADKLYDIADKLESKKLYWFAEQLRGAGMYMSNNIAEVQLLFPIKIYPVFKYCEKINI